MHRLKSIIRRTPFVLIQNQCRRHFLKGLFTVFGYVVPSVVADQHEVIAIEQSPASGLYLVTAGFVGWTRRNPKVL